MGKLSLEKEKKLLDLFCGNEHSSRPWMDKPWQRDGYVYATNGYELLRINKAIVNGDYVSHDLGKHDWPDSSCNYMLTYKEAVDILDSLPKEEEEVEVEAAKECDECDGTGYVTWEYEDSIGHTHYSDDNCPVCKGHGTIRDVVYKKTGNYFPADDIDVSFGGLYIYSSRLKTIVNAMQILRVGHLYITHLEQGKPIVFKVDNDIQFIVMPKLSSPMAQTDYNVKLREY